MINEKRKKRKKNYDGSGTKVMLPILQNYCQMTRYVIVTMNFCMSDFPRDSS